jgi:hypothetical protein
MPVEIMSSNLATTTIDFAVPTTVDEASSNSSLRVLANFCLVFTATQISGCNYKGLAEVYRMTYR